MPRPPLTPPTLSPSPDIPFPESAIEGAPGSVAPAAKDRRWWALAVLALAQVMVVLDTTIVNIALPSAQADIGITDANRSWVVTSYALAFGALLLLGGRIADYWGRKRTFLAGTAGFAIASGLGGLAQDGSQLFAARALQGLFAALLAPAALALLTIAFPSGKDRITAFAVFGSIGGAGSAVGLVLGGVLTEYASWRWCLLVNIPIAITAIVAAVPLVQESRATGSTRYDWPGVVLVVLGLAAVVFGLTRAEGGWSDPLALGLLAAGVVLLAAFVVVEARVENPLLPLRVPLDRDRGAAYLAALLIGATLLGGLLFVIFYLQFVLQYSPIRSGLASLPLTASIVLAAAVLSQLLPRTGPRPLMVAGGLLGAAGLFLLTRLPVAGNYVVDVLPGIMVLGVGLAFLFVPLQNIALLGVDERDAGVASALVNAAQQVGGSIGTALFSTIALTATSAYVPAAGTTATLAQLEATVSGYTTVFWWAGGLTLLIAPLVYLLVTARRGDLAATAVPHAL